MYKSELGEADMAFTSPEGAVMVASHMVGTYEKCNEETSIRHACAYGDAGKDN